MDYLPEDIPEGPLLDPVDTLSFLFLDGAGKSKLHCGDSNFVTRLVSR